MKKRITILLIALLLMCITFSSTAEFDIDHHWGLIDNNTLTPVQEEYNVSIGKNDTTTYKLYVNGSEFVVDDLYCGEEIYVATGLYHYLDGDTQLRFLTDTIILTCGGTSLLQGATNSLSFNPYNADIDFIGETNNINNAFVIDGSDDDITINADFIINNDTTFNNPVYIIGNNVLDIEGNFIMLDNIPGPLQNSRQFVIDADGNTPYDFYMYHKYSSGGTAHLNGVWFVDTRNLLFQANSGNGYITFDGSCSVPRNIVFGMGAFTPYIEMKHNYTTGYNDRPKLFEINPISTNDPSGTSTGMLINNPNWDYDFSANGTDGEVIKVDGGLNQFNITGDAYINDGDVFLYGTPNPEYIMFSSSGGSHEWSFFGGPSGFSIRDRDNSRNPFFIGNDALANSFRITPTNVVVNNPRENLDYVVHGNDTSNLFFVNAELNGVAVSRNRNDTGFVLDINGNCQATSFDETSDLRVKNIISSLGKNKVLSLCRNMSIYLFKYDNSLYDSSTNETMNETSMYDIDNDGYGISPIAQELYQLLLDTGYNESIASTLVKVGNDNELWSIHNSAILYIFARGWQINDNRISNIETLLGI